MHYGHNNIDYSSRYEHLKLHAAFFVKSPSTFVADCIYFSLSAHLKKSSGLPLQKTFLNKRFLNRKEDVSSKSEAVTARIAKSAG